jgi:maltooligosyltrehalose trehalohydrolase
VTGFAVALSLGATVLPEGLTRFGLWAPGCDTVALEVEGLAPLAMQRDPEGVFRATAACGAGAAYRYRVAKDLAVPDPVARAQQDDVHGASLVVDPCAYAWKHADWRGRPWHETILYEVHVGAAGGFAGVQAMLPRLAELGVTAIELMPIADFPGRHNWGYDGVLQYAPDASYGTVDQLKALIDAAHGLRLMVFLDVVYNHFGPDGNYIGTYAPDFFHHDSHTPWGQGIDFGQPMVRRFFIENALYWLGEYRFDGLRFDAVHAIGDNDFLRVMAAELRAAAEPDRHIHLVLENEHNAASLLRRSPHAAGYDAQWSDDFHNTLHVLLTGEIEAYYESFVDAAPLLAVCLAQGFAYQGQPSPHHDGRPRGEPSAHLPPTAFVSFLQNHDQVGNRAMGERLVQLAHPDALRAATVLLLLAPQIPMLFFGEEFASRTPFLFFTDFHDALADAVRKGRRREFARFAAFADAEARRQIPDPNDPATFHNSIIDPGEALSADNAAWLRLHADLLRLRHSQIIPRLPGASSVGAVALGSHAVRAAWRLGDGAVLTIAANFGGDAVACAPGPGAVLVFARAGVVVSNPLASISDTLGPRTAVVWLEQIV